MSKTQFRIINKLLPSKFKESMKKRFMQDIIEQNERMKANIPNFELKEHQVVNTRAIITREAMLELMPKDAVAAEIGVDQGNFTKKIVEITKPKKLHLVDNWGSERFNQDKKKAVSELFAEHIAKGQVEMNVGLSLEICQKFDDSYFDWIYLDTTHSYQLTIKELEAYRKKMKPNGIIAGHDYLIGNWNKMIPYGVIEAVYEFCVKYDWELLYLTMENQGKRYPSFAIRQCQK